MLRIILTIALACCAPVHGAPIPPGPVGSFVNNSAAPQTAQFNVSSGTVRGKLTAGEVKVTTLTVSGVIVSSFSGSGAALTGIPWAGVVKTGSNLNEITTRDHSVLTSTGTNSHAAIDSHILSSAAVHGSTASNLGSRIVQRDASGDFAARIVTASTFTGTLNGNAATATRATNVAGGSLGTIPYQTAANTTAMLPAGPFNYVLQGKGAAVPTWTSSPTITGANITAIPLSALSAGTLPVSIPASSITVTGTQTGTFGGPTQSAQITVGSDGRVRSIVQYPIPAVSTNAVLNTESYTWTKYQNFLSSVSVGSIYGDGTNLTGVNDVVARAGVAALDVTTTTLTQDLATEISNRQIADAAIGVTTGTLRTDLSAETLARGLADAAIGVTTGTLRTDLNSEISRATIREDAIAVSTGALEASKVNRAGDTMTGPLSLGAQSLTAGSATFSSATVNGLVKLHDVADTISFGTAFYIQPSDEINTFYSGARSQGMSASSGKTIFLGRVNEYAKGLTVETTNGHVSAPAGITVSSLTATGAGEFRGATLFKGDVTVNANNKLYFPRGSDQSPTAYIYNSVTGSSGSNLQITGDGSSAGVITMTPGSSGAVNIVGAATVSTTLGVTGNASVSGNSFSVGVSTFNCLYGNCGVGTTAPYATLMGVKATNPVVVAATNNSLSTGKVTQIGVDTDLNLGLLTSYDYAVGGMQLAINRFGGNVGIGDTSPDANLEILAKSNNAPASYLLAVSSQSDTTGNIMSVFNSGDVSIGAYAQGYPTLSILGASAGAQTLRLADFSSAWGFDIKNDAANARLDFVRHSNSAAGVAAMSIRRDTGYIGVGTNTPSAVLDVAAYNAIGDANNLILRNTYGGNADIVSARFALADVGNSYIKGGIFYQATGTGYGRGNIIIAQRATADAVNASTADVSMAILNSGKVGINTNNPLTPLEVVGGTKGDTIQVSMNKATNANKYSGLYALEYNGSDAYPLIWGDSRSDRDEVYIGGGAGSTDGATAVRLYTSSTRGGDIGTERLTINNYGNIYTPTAMPYAWAGPYGLLSAGLSIGAPNVTSSLVVMGNGPNENYQTGLVLDQKEYVNYKNTFRIRALGPYVADPANYGSRLAFSTSLGDVETTRLYIDQNGYVGLSTGVPQARLDVQGSAIINGNASLKTYTETKSSAAVSTTYDVSWSSGSVYWLSLNDNTTLTFSGAVEGQSLTLFVKQNVGSKAITWPTISWPSATAPTLTLTAGKTDIISLVYLGGVYYGFLGGKNY